VHGVLIEGDIQYCYRLMLDALCEHFVWIVQLEWFLGVFPNYRNPIRNASTTIAKTKIISKSGSLVFLMYQVN
jgi:hypothetical protein